MADQKISQLTPGTPQDGDEFAINRSGSNYRVDKEDITEENFTTTLKNKLDTVEDSADVTNATNVAAAGAVMDSGNETVNGIKTFGSFPVTPSSAPTTNYQVANKKYVDDNAGGGGDVSISGTPADNDFAKFTDASTIEGRSYAEVRSDLNIENGADVTDATNVNAAGATMNTDTDVKSNSWTIDEDDMTSNLDTKVPTQQSVKAYVDNNNAGDTYVNRIPTPNPLSFLGNYRVRSKSCSDPVDRIMSGWNNRPWVDYYSGKHNRFYFIYSYVDTVRECRVGYYDYDSASFGTIVDPNIAASTGDAHNLFAMIVSKNGYIIISQCYDDGYQRIYRSDSPEDISSFSLIDTLDTYSNYTGLSKTENEIVVDYRGTGSGGASQENRAISYSKDDGETWISPAQYLGLASGNWAYGTTYEEANGNGVFLTINILEEYGNLNYYAWGIIWTNDYETFGNLEYYTSNKKSGWSKNISTDGVINDSDIENNIAAIYGDDTSSGTDNNYLLQIEQLRDGSIVAVSMDGDRGASTTVDNLRTSVYDISTNTWTHNLADVSTDVPGILASDDHSYDCEIIPFDKKNIRLIIQVSETNLEYEYWSTADGGSTWSKLDDLTSSSGYDMGRIQGTNCAISSQYKLTMINDNGDLKFFLFDKRLR